MSILYNGTTTTINTPKLPSFLTKENVLEDYRIGQISRQISLIARREVLTGKAMFCTTDDGKEVLQLAMARAFQKGDFRAGYYRGHTLMLALGIYTPEDFFAHLYADAVNDISSDGRSTMNHHATYLIDKKGNWLQHTALYNISSDISSTAGQMARALGLALASKKYRDIEDLDPKNNFSHKGNEVCFVNIGDGSTSEGIFWEVMNAATVQQVPMAVSVWDDGYGISVPTKQQTVKANISKALGGFKLDENGDGMDIYALKGWDYPRLCEAYRRGIRKMRHTHIPALFHIQDLTQPQGHSSSGSHERYKTKERLQFEKEYDCLKKMREWIIEAAIATETELEQIEKEAKVYVKQCRKKAWKAFIEPIQIEQNRLNDLYQGLLTKTHQPQAVKKAQKTLNQLIYPVLSNLVKNARQTLHFIYKEQHIYKTALENLVKEWQILLQKRINTQLYSQSPQSALNIPTIPPKYEPKAPLLNGYQILNTFFDKAFEKYPNTFAFGEDVGKIGDVNQGFAGMQEKYGKARIFDTGIREWSIMGKAIGMAMRGLRPIAEIQYLDYLIYGLSPLSDDLSTMRYRTNNRQMAPAIIRTRGHRLMGIWHSGSPMSMLLSSLRGMYILVPRNMTQAAGFYNTLLQSDDPGLVIECLNAYRLKEPLPKNMGTYTVPLGEVEILQKGTDISIVTYGACIRIAQEAIEILQKVYGISVELIDVQSLLPFDIEHRIVASLKKTNRVLFLDEDVPGGASAYMMQEVLEKQNGYRYLDSAPTTLTAKAHRPAYGWDGDYCSKPSAEDVIATVVDIIKETEPRRFPQQFLLQ